MPLGFGKSILTTAAADAAATGVGAYRQKNALSTGNLAAHTIEGIDWTADNDVSIVWWFRANGADADGDSDDWIDGTSGGTSGSCFLQIPNGASNGVATGFVRLQFTLQDFGWQFSLNSSETDGANAYVDSRGGGSAGGSSGGSASSVAASVFDGSWKCLMMSFQSDHNTGTNVSSTSQSTAANFRNCYVGDDNFVNSPEGHTAGPILLNSGQYDYADGHIGYKSNTFTATVPTASNSGLVGPGLHWGPMWVYNTFLDFDTQSIRRRFYNPSNTDGLVTPTNTGTTTAGATQPLLYLYWTGSALANGGSDTVTLTKRTVGTGGDVVDVSDGPGSGGTI